MDDFDDYYDNMQGAEQWLFENPDLWICGENGFEFFTDNIPDCVKAYAQNYNEVQKAFETSIKIKNAL